MKGEDWLCGSHCYFTVCVFIAFFNSTNLNYTWLSLFCFFTHVFDQCINGIRSELILKWNRLLVFIKQQQHRRLKDCNFGQTEPGQTYLLHMTSETKKIESIPTEQHRTTCFLHRKSPFRENSQHFWCQACMTMIVDPVPPKVGMTLIKTQTLFQVQPWSLQLKQLCPISTAGVGIASRRAHNITIYAHLYYCILNPFLRDHYKLQVIEKEDMLTCSPWWRTSPLGRAWSPSPCDAWRCPCFLASLSAAFLKDAQG